MVRLLVANALVFEFFISGRPALHPKREHVFEAFISCVISLYVGKKNQSDVTNVVYHRAANLFVRLEK